MPQNNNLRPIQFPQELKFGKKPTTEFVNNLKSINVVLMSAPSMEELMGYIPEWARATWMESTESCKELRVAEKLGLVRDVFKQRTLPSALETINLVFQIDGISLQEVTHILRHRQASFSADCSADKWWTDKRALVPNAIENSEEFYRRYCEITEAAKQLYCDMIDSRKVSILDARYILPRNLETFYYMKMPLNACISFIIQRLDRQIQPETDNIIAYQMYLALLEKYPIANGLIDIDMPATHYMRTARSGHSSNIYRPEPNSDLFDWHSDDFIYDCTRDKLNGTDEGADNAFNDYLEYFRNSIAAAEERNRNELMVKYNTTYDEIEFITRKFREV